MSPSQQAVKQPTALASVPSARLFIAQEMVESYLFNQATGVSTFTVPAGISDVEAMTALNDYLKKHLPGLNRDAVYGGDLSWYENLPQEFPSLCCERDYSHARGVTIQGIVKGTREDDRATQEGGLSRHSLVFSDPRDQALAAALHACTNRGFDLFLDCKVRGVVPGVVLYTDRISGVHVGQRHDDDFDYNLAASGSPS